MITHGILCELSSVLEACSDLFVREHVLTGVTIDVTPFEKKLEETLDWELHGRQLEEEMMKGKQSPAATTASPIAAAMEEIQQKSKEIEDADRRRMREGWKW